MCIVFNQLAMTETLGTLNDTSKGVTVKIRYISTLSVNIGETEKDLLVSTTGSGNNKGSIFIVSYSEIAGSNRGNTVTKYRPLSTDSISGKCALLFTSKYDFDKWNNQYEIMVNSVNKSEFLDYIPWLEDYTNSDGSIPGKIEITSKRLVKEFVSNNISELIRGVISEQELGELSEEIKRELLREFRRSFDFIGLRVFKKQSRNIVPLNNTISLGRSIKGWHNEHYCKKVLEVIEDLCVSTLYLLSILQMSKYNICSFTPQSAFLQNIGNLKDVPIHSPDNSDSLNTIVKIIKEQISTGDTTTTTTNTIATEYGDNIKPFVEPIPQGPNRPIGTSTNKTSVASSKYKSNVNDRNDCSNIWEHHSIGSDVLFSVKKTSRLLVIPNGFSKPDKNKEIDFEFFKYSIECIPFTAPETLLFQLYDQKSECFCAHMMILGSAYSVNPFMDDGDKYPDDYWWYRFVPPSGYKDEFTQAVKDAKTQAERTGLPVPFMCYEEIVSSGKDGLSINLLEHLSLYLFNLALFIGPFEFERQISEELFKLEPLVEIENYQREENYVRGISKDLGLKLISIVEKYTGKNTTKKFSNTKEFTKFIPKSCSDLFTLSLKCNPHERLNPIAMVYSMTEKLKHRYTSLPYVEMGNLPLHSIPSLSEPELGLSTGGFKIIGNELSTQSGSIVERGNSEFLKVIESIILYTGTNEYYYKTLIDEANVEIVTRRILGAAASDKVDFGIIRELKSYVVKSAGGLPTSASEQLEAMKKSVPKEFANHSIFKSLEYEPSVISKDTLESAASVKKLQSIKEANHF